MIIETVATHPMTTEQIHKYLANDISYRRLCQKLRKFRVQTKVKTTTIAVKVDGRMAVMYFRGNAPEKKHHEYYLTEFAMVYGIEITNWIRGKNVHKTIKPDGQFFIGPYKFWVEMDLGTIRSEARMIERYERYNDVEDPVLWITLTEARKEWLRQRATNEAFLFATLSAVQADPFGKVYVDLDGVPKRIQKPIHKEES